MVKYVAPKLSHQSRGGLDWNTPSSFRSDLIRIISAVTLAIALYSASMLDLEMVACFLEL
jgi:hypothetical protein